MNELQVRLRTLRRYLNAIGDYFIDEFTYVEYEIPRSAQSARSALSGALKQVDALEALLKEEGQ